MSWVRFDRLAFIFIASFCVLISCKSKEWYTSSNLNGVEICDLNEDFMESSDILDVKIFNQLTINDLEYLGEWDDVDVNRTRCGEEKLPYERALRVRVLEEKWIKGYAFEYLLYFGENKKLIKIEARHVYIGGKLP